MSSNLKRSNIFKVYSLLMIFLFSFQLIAYSYPKTEEVKNPFISKYQTANKLFKYEEFKSARTILEKIVKNFKEQEGILSFKGETFLLLGAVYEKLKEKKLAVKFYCKAKKLLGENTTSNENIKLKELKYYNRSCNTAVYAQVGKKKGKSFLGKLLGLAVLIGGGYLLWKYVIKEKVEELNNDKTDYTDPSNWGAGFDCYKFAITWKSEGTVYCQTGSSCKITLSWKDGHYPQPSSSNNWDDSGEWVIATTGSVKTLTAKLTFKLKGCNNGKIKNTIYVDGKKVFDRTDTFVNGCAEPSMDASEISQVILSVSSTGSHTIRHIVDLSVNASKQNAIKINNDIK